MVTPRLFFTFWVMALMPALLIAQHPHTGHEEILVDEQEDWQTYVSESGLFLLHYVTDPESSNRVPDADENESGIPDFIENAASFADSTYRFLIETHNYPDFTKADRKYALYFQDVPYQGFTRKVEDGTEIILHRNFEEIRDGANTKPPPDNADPDGRAMGALKNTIAHEIMHAIQYHVLDDFLESAWLEMDAVMVSHHVFPDVFDYLNDISGGPSIFNHPDQSSPVAYAHASFMNYFTENYGLGFWSDVWNYRVGSRGVNMRSAINAICEQRELIFPYEFAKMHLWHFASGNRTDEAYGFENAPKYPSSRVVDSYNGFPAEVINQRFISSMAAHYYEVINKDELTGPLYFSLFTDDSYASAGVLIHSNGQWHEALMKLGSSGFHHMDSGFMWEDVDSLGVVITNPSYTQVSYQFMVGTPETISSLLLGDVNDSGTVTLSDANTILNHTIEAYTLKTAPRFQADVSGNQNVTAYDAYLIYKYLNGDIESFPADETGDGYGPDPFQFNSPYDENDLGDLHFFHPITNGRPGLFLEAESEIYKTDEEAHITLRLENRYSFNSGTVMIQFDHAIENPWIAFEGYDQDEIHTRTLMVGNEFRFSFATLTALAEDQEIKIYFKPVDDGKLTISGTYALFDEQWYPAAEWKNELELTIEPNVPVTTEKEELPQKVALQQNYPNPFNPTTVITYQLPENSNVRLEVFDLLGRRVALIINETQSAGTHSVSFDASELSGGMYVYRLRAGEVVLSRKMMLVR